MSPLTASAKGLFKTYHQAGVPIEVLRGLNLDIAEGETVAILGQSGSGKTTFLSMMAGLDRPDSGYVDLIGMNITAMSEKALTGYRAENLSIVFQQFHLMSYLSALENVMLPLDILARAKGSKIQSEEIAKDTLERVGLGSRLSHLPHQLSGGEKQRVAIARALVTRPKLLLADEPSRCRSYSSPTTKRSPDSANADFRSWMACFSELKTRSPRDASQLEVLPWIHHESKFGIF
jgi:putative ABC transport system ATP-binding protein